MLRYITFFIFFISLSSFAFCAEISLKDKLAEAEPGSYLVTEQSKTYTFLHVYEKRGNSIVLEEVVIPAARFQRQLSWREWFERGAPGHTAWTLTQINLQSGTLEEVYSFPHQGWVDTSQADHFMTTLLNLHFKEVPDSQRRRIGLPPGYNKPDHRPIWSPRLVVEGTALQSIPFTAWKARWPSDGSELARKTIEVYLPEVVHSPATPHYPVYFPFWLEVEGKIGSAKIRVIDSGMSAHSPKPHLPRRAPQLIGNGSLIDKGLTLQLKSPSYFQEFVLIAEEESACFSKTFVLPCQASQQDDLVTLFVPKEELDKFLTPGEHYRFSISPKDDLTLCVETPHAMTYR